MAKGNHLWDTPTAGVVLCTLLGRWQTDLQTGMRYVDVPLHGRVQWTQDTFPS